ncbi:MULTISPECIES: hypothetical protein [unclassified Guyparkeria]|uniref:hypothetical protein n=1 Tax=unclassified Guyparkeria TaxID=2626246 RepID=UPI00073385D1|nr:MULTISPECIES: hypothetical protein [unclassified Guyparkeria]KTG16101.1 hypothetical protein AUR63_04475 [Guyparkeria sp. XI15]OAE84952.1 hypothetical protein AWR35_04485 [Guyparkeria sp. WRN-7]
MTDVSSIEASIEELDGLALSLDQIASRIEAGDQDETLSEMAEGLDQAEAQIAELVVEAESRQQLGDPRLVALKSDWLNRFERFFGLVERARRQLNGEAELRLSRHRASDAYLKNQVS